MENTEPTYKNVFFTVEMAKNALNNMGKNYRIFRQKDVDRYARAIIKGKWKLNGVMIRFDKNDCMFDGQHRCRAIIQANLGIQTAVGYNLDREVEDTIDIGLGRSFSQIMHNIGLPYRQKDLAIAKGIQYHKTIPNYWNVRYNHPKLEPYEAKNLIELYLDGIMFVRAAGGIKAAILIPIVMAYYHSPKDRKRLEELVTLLKSGKLIDSRDGAAILLRNLNYLSKIKDQEELFEKSQSGVQAFLKHEPNTKLRAITEDVFPIKRTSIVTDQSQ
jgi:hypothetical protein